MPERVLQRLAAGDQAALRECAKEFGPMVRGLARRYLRGRSWGDIDETVHDILTEVWRSAGRYDERRASEASFIATIAHRRLIDEVRGRRRAPTALFESAEAPESSEAFADKRDEARLALEVLAGLRPEAQECLRLAFLHGKSHRAIAEGTGIPLGTVKTHLRDGVAALRFALDIERRERRTRGRRRTG